MPSLKKRLFWTILILLVCLIAISVPFYNRSEPMLLGIPFFYYFQLAWIVVSGVVTALAYRAGL